jgi:hypothetical protein
MCAYEPIEVFYNKLLEIDEYCNTDEFRKKMFGEKAYNQYSYQPLIRTPEIDEDEPKLDKKGLPIYQPPFTKIKLELEYEEDQDDPKNIPKFSLIEKVDKTRSHIDLKSYQDVINLITWQSKVRFIISFSKLYAMKTKAGKDKKGYGIILKASCIEFQRSAINNNKMASASDEFIDDDDDNDDKQVSTKEQITRGSFFDGDDEDNDDNKLSTKPQQSSRESFSGEIVSSKTKSKLDADLDDNADADANADVDADEEIIEEPKIKPKPKPKTKSKA